MGKAVYLGSLLDPKGGLPGDQKVGKAAHLGSLLDSEGGLVNDLRLHVPGKNQSSFIIPVFLWAIWCGPSKTEERELHSCYGSV